MLYLTPALRQDHTFTDQRAHILVGRERACQKQRQQQSLPQTPSPLFSQVMNAMMVVTLTRFDTHVLRLTQ